MEVRRGELEPQRPDARLVGVELDEHVAARTQELSDPAKEDDGARADPDVAVEQQRGLPSR